MCRHVGRGRQGPPKFSDLATCLMCIHYIRASYNIECGIHIAVSCHVFYPSVAWYCPEWKEIESMPYFTRDLLRALSILRWEYTQKYQVNLYLFMDYVKKLPFFIDWMYQFQIHLSLECMFYLTITIICLIFNYICRFGILNTFWKLGILW